MPAVARWYPVCQEKAPIVTAAGSQGLAHRALSLGKWQRTLKATEAGDGQGRTRWEILCVCVCAQGRVSLGPICGRHGAHRLIHFELSTGLGAEELLGAGGCGELSDHVGEQQEVVEEKPMQFLVALGLI